jgi:hypothetical protein
MKNQGDSPGIDLSILEEIWRRGQMRGEVARDIEILENQIRQRRHSTHLRFLDQVAAKAGINRRDFIEEGRRRNKVEQRILTRGYERIRLKAKSLAQEELQHRRGVRKRYLESIGKDQGKEPADPELKFVTAVAGGSRAAAETDTPGGIVGGSECREHVFAERSYSNEIAVGLLPPAYEPHRFYPRAFASTGDDDLGVWVRLRQTLTLRHDGLERGRGDFQVNRLRVNLSGVGYSERRDGECCPLLLCSTGLIDAQYVRLGVTVLQAVPTGFLDAQLLETDLYTISGPNVSEPIVIELGGRSFPCDFRLINPDRGGSEPWIYVELETFVSAYNESARAEIDLCPPDSGGVELSCVSLFGDYVG